MTDVETTQYLTTLGILAAGSAGAVGTGAFTNVNADREVSVAVADDADAVLRLVPVPGSGNSEFVLVEGGQLTIDVSDSNDDVLGDDVNAGAITIIDDLFRIENQGTQTVYVWLLESGGRTGSKWHAFYAGSWSQDGVAISLADYNNGVGTLKGDGRQRQPQYVAGIETAAVELGVGEYVDVGLVVDTPDGSAGSAVLKEGQTVQINANADEEELADVFTPAYDPDSG